jgi:hypothetical protein
VSTHQFRGRSTRRQRRRAGFSQASTRRPITLYDQHGREWHASVGIKTGRPTGQIVQNFHAPWMPDQKYLKVNPENTSELFIDYDAMLNNRRVAHQEYHKLALDAARELKIDPPNRGEYNESIIKMVRSKPPKPVEPIIAAMQENQWILGFTAVVDPRLERFVIKPRGDNSDILGEFDFRDASRSFADAKDANVSNVASGPQRAKGPTPQPNEQTEEQIEEDGDAFTDFDAAAGEESNVESMLADLEEEHDADAVGGKTVSPAKAARPTPHSKRPSNKKKRAQQGNRPTLASGAQPVVGE